MGTGVVVVELLTDPAPLPFCWNASDDSEGNEWPDLSAPGCCCCWNPAASPPALLLSNSRMERVASSCCCCCCCAVARYDWWCAGVPGYDECALAGEP